MIRLEMRETAPDSDALIKYRAVEGADRETVIRNYVDRFPEGHEPNALRQILGIHTEIRLGDQLYSFSDENGPLVEVANG